MAGGHALVLFVGHSTRPHSDIDVSIFRENAPLLRHLLEGWDLSSAHPGVLWPWTTDTMEPPCHSIWCRTGTGQPWGLQVMIDEGTPHEWVCHRHPDIHLPLDEVLLHSPDRIRHLRPEMQLLLKAKDDVDFATVFPLLSPEQAGWLTGALGRHYPDHRWLHGMGY